ncbi:universal stress protein [Rossellomorea vietnamensis]|jgi:nucleotide-binding universal stress UspA family protein|uniref:Universal stress protein n=1 Tax=Rossellomorea vietnamensis TaxID=218284 RepID=A0A0P6W4F2_9BACI|nr:universal stress protein [Rossellomorea vietnamensis]KPL60429.1 universal stress protein [Rossellomorea vietnamensis]
MYKRILLAADGSEHSKRSAQHAIELALKFDSVVDLVYVVDGDTSKYDVLHHGNTIEREEARKKRVHPLDEMLEESGVSHNIHMLHGEPGPMIIDYSEELQSDLIVIGSRGLNSLQTMILGSVSHKVVKHAKCPVIVIK